MLAVTPRRKRQIAPYVAFESGAMGDWERVTEIRMASHRLAKNCVPSTLNSMLVATSNEVRLRQSQSEFKQKLAVPLKASDGLLTYVEETKRQATTEELNRMRATFNGTTQTEFDIVVNIRAMFKANRLVDYSVSKIESF